MRTLIFLMVSLSAISVFGQSLQTVELFNNGISSSRLAEHHTALKKFKEACTRASHEKASIKFLAKVYYNLGVSRYHLGRTAEAIADFKKAIEFANGRYEKASYALGLAHSELDDLTNAENAFLDALSVNKRNGEAWFDLAFIYLNRSEHDRAEAAFANAIKFGTVDVAIGFNNLGVLLAIKGKLPEAARHFQNAVATSSGTFDGAVVNLARCRSMIDGREKLLANTDFRFTLRRQKNI